MKTSAPTICVLECERDLDTAGDEFLLVLAAKQLAALCGFAWMETPVAHTAIEAKLLAGDAVVLITTMPRALAVGEKIDDFIFAHPALTFLLAHPACFVLFVTGMDREYLDQELAAWSRRAGRTCAAREQLASATPLFWSFVTISQLTRDDAPAGTREVLVACATSALFDPTGLRSFLLALLKDTRADADRTSTRAPRAPHFAIVADDEEDIASTHAYHLRRLGYSTLIVHNADTWRQIIPGGAWAEHAAGRYDLLLFDDFMNFQPGEPRIGHAMLDQLSANVKVYATGMRMNRGDNNRSNVIAKPITDAHDLRRKLDRSSAVYLADQLVDACGNDESIHLAPSRALRRAARHVTALAAHIEEQNERKFDAALHYLEAYHLIVGVDESAAAHAFVRFELIEIGVIAGQHPDAFSATFWRDREDEIRRVLNATFQDKTTEALWWTARAFQEIEIIMDASLVAADLLLQVDASTNRAVMRLQWNRECRRRAPRAFRYVFWLRWANPLLWLKWALRSSFTLFHSFGRVFTTWIVCNLAFAVVYAELGDRCDTWKGIPLPWPVRAVIASFGAGTGLAFPQDYGLCLPADGHLWLGSLQRALALVYLWKILDLFVTRTRTRA